MNNIMTEKNLATKVRNLPVLMAIPRKYHGFIRDKAIERARTRIIVAGSDPKQFSQEDLEVVVKEEEDKIKMSIKEKGVLVVLAFFGLNLFG